MMLVSERLVVVVAMVMMASACTVEHYFSFICIYCVFDNQDPKWKVTFTAKCVWHLCVSETKFKLEESILRNISFHFDLEIKLIKLA